MMQQINDYSAAPILLYDGNYEKTIIVNVPVEGEISITTDRVHGRLFSEYLPLSESEQLVARLESPLVKKACPYGGKSLLVSPVCNARIYFYPVYRDSKELVLVLTHQEINNGRATYHLIATISQGMEKSSFDERYQKALSF